MDNLFLNCKVVTPIRVFRPGPYSETPVNFVPNDKVASAVDRNWDLLYFNILLIKQNWQVFIEGHCTNQVLTKINKA